MDKTVNKTKNKARGRLLAAFWLNIAVVVMELIGTSLSLRGHGLGLFMFYTEDSNLFALFACALCAYFEAQMLWGKRGDMPRVVRVCKYMAVCTLLVTLVVVLTILAPTLGADGYRIMMLTSSMLYHHFLCPVIAALSLFFFEPAPKLSGVHSLFALVPTILYALVILTLNVARIIVGPYPFLHIYEQPIGMSIVWFVVILGVAYLLAELTRRVGNRIS